MLDDWIRKMEALKLLIRNYGRAMKIIKGTGSERLYKQVLADDEKIREVLGK